MSFTSALTTNDGLATITLAGELDASQAGDFRKLVEQAAADKPKRLVLRMEGLEYMSSAGLRALIFAKQKMGQSVDVYIVGANEGVTETLVMTGFQHSVVMMDKYDAAAIEKI
jgi:anti-anti-sigma factor